PTHVGVPPNFIHAQWGAHVFRINPLLRGEAGSRRLHVPARSFSMQASVPRRRASRGRTVFGKCSRMASPTARAHPPAGLAAAFAWTPPGREWGSMKSMPGYKDAGDLYKPRGLGRLQRGGPDTSL